MKKGIKRILIIVATGLLILLLPVGWYLINFSRETGRMSPLPTGKLTEDLYIVRDSFVNMYLVEGDDGYIAIDAGVKADHIRQELALLGVDPDLVRAVFLTHTDSDHVGALEIFSNAEVYISEAEEQMIDGTTARAFIVHNKLKTAPELVRAGEFLDPAGISVECIPTPGHTPGSISYLVKDKYLFVGDSLSLHAGKAGQFNEFFNMDTATQEESLKLLAGLADIEYLFTAHYGMSDQYARALSDYRE